MGVYRRRAAGNVPIRSDRRLCGPGTQLGAGVGVALVVVNTMMDDLVEDLDFDKSVGGGVAASALFLGAGVGSLVAGPFERIVCQYGQLCIGLL